VVNQFADMLGYHVEPVMLYQASLAVNPLSYICRVNRKVGQNVLLKTATKFPSNFAHNILDKFLTV